MEVAVSPELSKLLTMVKPVEPLAPYSICTYVGKSTALVLPDGDGEHLTLLANQAAVEDNEGKPKLLVVHGIASNRVTAVVHGRETIVPAKAGLKFTIKVIGDAPVQFVPASDQAKPMCRLAMKNSNEVTTVPSGSSITFERKTDTWQQV
jgi:hypothetical protein